MLKRTPQLTLDGQDYTFSADRLSALTSYGILDTPPEEGFDNIVELAASVCGCPVALVSLVDRDRQWFKARVNFPPCETDLNSSVCAHALIEPDMLVISDLAADPRTAANPLVTGEPFIRFYAGVPLRMEDGHVLGSLCVIDQKPRPQGLSIEQKANLRRLARSVVGLIGLRRAVSNRETVLVQQAIELRRERRLELLIEASATLLSTAKPAAELLSLLQNEASGLGFEQSYAYAVTPDGAHLALLQAIGADDATRAFLQHVSTGIPLCGIVAECGRPLILDNLQADTTPRYEIARSSGISAYASYPILSRGRVSGVISFATTSAESFDPEALAFFATVTRLLSLAQERVDGEQALRVSEERLDLTFQASEMVGWWDWDVQADKLVANAPFARLIGADPDALASGVPVAAFWQAVHPDDQAHVRVLVEHSMAIAGPYLAEYRMIQPDGSTRWVMASGKSYHDGQGRPSRLPGILTDTTDIRLAAERQAALTELGDRLRDVTTLTDATAVASEIAGRALRLSRAGYGAIDLQAESVEIHEHWGARSLAGRHAFREFGSFFDDLKLGRAVVIDDVKRDPRTAASAGRFGEIDVAALINIPVFERGQFISMFFALHDAPHVWTADETAFLVNVADRTRAAVAKLQAEAQQAVLNEELAHRMKNTMAMVQAVAIQTLKDVQDRAAVAAFTERIHALSSAHDLLLQTSWSSAHIKPVIEKVLGNFRQLERFAIDGPDFPLGPRAVVSLSMLLHELATNAMKYGALSTQGGRVCLTWRVEDGPAGSEVVMDWVEQGGPPAVEPTRRGFGSRLIRLGLIGTGGVQLRYEGSGFKAEMRALLAHVQQS